MRRFFDGLCVVAAFVIAGASRPATDKTEAIAPVAAPSVACLGDVLNERDAGNYLTAADYPAFAALTADRRRIFICGDSIPPVLPSSQRAGFVSRRH